MPINGKIIVNSQLKPNINTKKQDYEKIHG